MIYNKAMLSHTLDEFLTKYIEDYMFGDLQTIKAEVSPDTHPGNAAYLMTSAICAGIEFMGSLLDIHPEPQKCEVCKMTKLPGFSPFYFYCRQYMTLVDERYKGFGMVGRELIRNGLMHSFATKGKVAITRQGNRETAHLVRYSDAGLVVINPNFLYEDFMRSYNDFVKPELLKEGDIRTRALHNYEQMQELYGAQVDRTLVEASKSLKSWPWLHQDIPFDPQMSEIVEANGDLILVS
ncbi:MAG TPA: hypothetical protein VFT87_05280 [Candidatus Saccharimonadales bacterium]|nr:hypothetical protein [Candidatus Saccharimonadales bacterium]